ncbi:MAG: DNA polymerase III subunit gamma/tau [Parcubacteria group bacterium]
MNVLYRKHRPQTFAEIHGQEHVVRTLNGAILSGKPGHAYMFTGPRGTGKTTMARLLAKALNCLNRKSGESEPCNKCDSCTSIGNGASLDLIEIDAASNRGIDEIRNIRDSAQVAATSSNYKVFIIDEVHMLTPPAFNALLKTLEEPPSHVLFVLATTEAHKVLDTILSRVQRFDFKKIPNKEIISKLKKIAKIEKLDAEPEALEAIATYSNGSLRDAESALNKLMSYAGSKITAKDASEILGIVDSAVHSELLNALLAHETKTAITKIADLYESGIHIEHFTQQFINYLRKKLIDNLDNKQGESPHELANMISVFIDARTQLKNTPVPTLPLELAIVELTNNAAKDK